MEAVTWDVANVELRERNLFPPIKKYFNDLGYLVYCEVPSFSRCIDCVAVKGEEHIGIELKTGLTKKVIYQAHHNQLSCDKSYAVVGTNPSKKGLEQCEKNGIGVISIKDGIVKEILAPSGTVNLYKHYDFTGWEEGTDAGNPMLKGLGPTYEVMERIKAYLRIHPEAGWREIYANVQNHYASYGALASSMSHWRGTNIKDMKHQISIENLADAGKSLPSS